MQQFWDFGNNPPQAVPIPKMPLHVTFRALLIDRLVDIQPKENHFSVRDYLEDLPDDMLMVLVDLHLEDNAVENATRQYLNIKILE